MRGTLLALMVCVFGVTTGEFVLTGILPAVAGDLEVSIPAAGLLVTAYALGMIVGGPLLTAITAGRPRKRLVLALLVVAVAGNLLSALAPGYEILFAARIVTALVTSTFFANAIVIVISSAPAGKQGATVAKLVFGMNLAMILGAPLGTWIGEAFGWRATFGAITACCAVGLLLVARFVPGDQAGTRNRALGEFAVFRDRDLLLAITTTAVANIGLLMVFTYLAPLLTGPGSFAAGAVAPMLLIYGVGATIGNLLGGRLADRALLPSQLSALSVLLVLLIALRVSPTPVVTGLLVFAAGAVGFSVIPGMQSRVLSTAAAAPTLAIAVNASAYQLAAACAGWLGGRIIAGPGLPAIYLVAAITTVLGIGLTALALRRDRVGPGELVSRTENA
ncbi:MFS transporter [Kribbella sp. NBC_00889]|uniref:MFS transporter n=1 Tax=Kribbella sp. NBC_00889 TaxID=2975974 RepID=UPI003870A9CE|nr:MFS transporter [Kribbella sp. NBC_00889]